MSIKVEHQPIISERVDYALGLNGNVRKTTPLLNGMSGGAVLRVETAERDLVIKNNPITTERVRKEIRGYKKLRGTPLAEYMLNPIYMCDEESVLAIPFFGGVQLREGVKNGTLSTQTALGVVAELLSLKKSWWSRQEKVYPNGNLSSMQRDEWADTREGIGSVCFELSKRYGISIAEFWKLPISHEGQNYPALTEVISRVEGRLLTPPTYGKLAHNDVTGANIMFNPENRSIRVIDTEWAGIADPAETLVRMTKYISTTTVNQVQEPAIRVGSGGLIFETHYAIPQTARTIQEYGKRMVDVFGLCLADPTFRQRYNEYLAGSYLRELALAKKRGDIRLGILAIVKAAEAVTD